MKIGAMFGNIVQSFFKPPVTERYPFERYPAPERLRGKLVWDASKCSGCQLCVKDCPADALKLIVIDKAAKRFVMNYQVDRCTFCAQCVVSCRFDCLEMSDEQWELASTTRNPFMVYYGQENDIQAYLAKSAQPNVDAIGED